MASLMTAAFSFPPYIENVDGLQPVTVMGVVFPITLRSLVHANQDCYDLG